MTLHQEQTHPRPVEGCFGCKVGSVRLGLARLKNDNRDGTTQSERARETLDAARAAGVDAQPVSRWI